MEKDLSYFIIYVLISFSPNFFNIYIVNYFLEGKFSFKRTILYALVLSLIMATFFTLAQPNPVINKADEKNEITSIVIYFVFFFGCFKKISLRLISAVALAVFASGLIQSIINIIWISALDFQNDLMLILNLIFSILFAFITITKKISFITIFNHYFKTTRSAIFFSITLTITTGLWYYFNNFYPRNHHPHILIPCLLLVVFSLLLFLPFYQWSSEKAVSQEKRLLEQQNYLLYLEQSHQKIRDFQYHYKNDLAALYLNAKAGDTVRVQEYINENVPDFDPYLVRKINQSTSLANIQLTELRSLILTKLIIMEQMDIKAELEVANAIKTIPISIPHLIQCLGIMIDNAIEVTSSDEHISLIIVENKEDLTITITNPRLDRASLLEVWKKNDSIQGFNSDLNLNKFHEIISKYNNVYEESYADKTKFKQILKIKNN